MWYVFAWTVALALGQLVSFAVIELNEPGLPSEVRLGVGLFAGVVFGVVFTVNRLARGRAFELARLGDRAACAALLTKRRAGGGAQKMDPFGTAALEVVVGETA